MQTGDRDDRLRQGNWHLQCSHHDQVQCGPLIIHLSMSTDVHSEMKHHGQVQCCFLVFSSHNYQLQLSWQWHSSTILSVNCPTVWSMQTFGKVIKSKIETLSTIQFNTKVIIFEVQAMMRTVINWLVGFNTRPPKTETSNIVGSGSQNVHPPLLRPRRSLLHHHHLPLYPWDDRQKRRGDCKVLPQLCKQSISKVWSRWIVRILFKWHWKYAQE